MNKTTRQTVEILDGTRVDVYNLFEKISFFFQGCFLDDIDQDTVDYNKNIGGIWANEKEIDEAYIDRIFSVDFIMKKIVESEESKVLGKLNKTNIRDLKNLQNIFKTKKNLLPEVVALAKKIIKHSSIRINDFHQFKNGKEPVQGKRYVFKAGYMEEKDGIFIKTQKFVEEILPYYKEENEEYIENMLDLEQSAPATKITVTTSARVRKPEVREFVRFRANGICELCDQKAPFNNPKGEPFLEVHHIDYLCDDGHDSPDNAAALCPNCHRKMHILNDSKDVKKLKKKAKTGT